MNLSPQSPSSEEPEGQPVLSSSEEPSPQPSPASDALPEEGEQQPVDSASEDISTQAASSSEPPMEEAEQHLASPSEPDETETSVLDEDETSEPAQPESSPSQPSQSGVFVRKGLLIAAVSAVVVVALLATLLVFVTRPKDPPTDWIASFTPPPGSSTGKILYYLHWTNQNGELNGQLQLATIANGIPQSLAAPATGLYNRDNHIIYVVITINGQADTLTGKINDANDTLNLNP
ncbi:MAG: hypothetical protein JO031_07260, partial [Ktedonobacteraceae bacterium]|nr:hypothetical protein [Ktedonobacteraceae bacterium]